MFETHLSLVSISSLAILDIALKLTLPVTIILSISSRDLQSTLIAVIVTLMMMNMIRK